MNLPIRLLAVGRAQECLGQVLDECVPSNKFATSYLPDCLEHAAHATDEHDLLFENLAAASLGLVLLCSLVAKQVLYVLSRGVGS